MPENSASLFRRKWREVSKVRDIRELYNELRSIDIIQNPSASYALSVRLEMIADHLRASRDIKWAERFDDLANVVEGNARNAMLALTPYSRK